MTQPAQKWRIKREVPGEWLVTAPDGLFWIVGGSHADAVAYMEQKQREALEKQLKEHPGAALALLLIAGLAAAAQKQAGQK